MNRAREASKARVCRSAFVFLPSFRLRTLFSSSTEEGAGRTRPLIRCRLPFVGWPFFLLLGSSLVPPLLLSRMQINTFTARLCRLDSFGISRALACFHSLFCFLCIETRTTGRTDAAIRVRGALPISYKISFPTPPPPAIDRPCVSCICPSPPPIPPHLHLKILFGELPRKQGVERTKDSPLSPSAALCLCFLVIICCCCSLAS